MQKRCHVFLPRAVTKRLKPAKDGRVVRALDPVQDSDSKAPLPGQQEKEGKSDKTAETVDNQVPAGSSVKGPLSGSDSQTPVLYGGTKPSRHCSTLLSAIENQTNPPYVHVGSISPRKIAPFYHRHLRSPVALCSALTVARDMSHSRPSDRSYSKSKKTKRQKRETPRPINQEKNGLDLEWKEQPGLVQFYCFLGRSKEDRPMPDKGIERSDYYPRSWEYTACGREYMRHGTGSRPHIDFTVMSYNLLAQCLLRDNMYLYSHCHRSYLDWDHRKKQLLRELRHHKPDIICLQEVEREHYNNFFSPELAKIGYDGRYVGRTGDKLDGCATFYNTSKFHLETSIPVEYFHPAAGPILDRDNVALIVKLKPCSAAGLSEDRVCVANTHLLFNPRRGDIKLAQVMLLLAELDKCAALSQGSSSVNSGTYHPVIMCGDFNSEPYSHLYSFLSRGDLGYHDLLCRTISGQQEGYERGTDTYLQKDFFPKVLGISDSCQYLEKRQVSGSGASEELECQGTQGSGVLTHGFNLVSAYQHTVARLNHRSKEITTMHKKAECTLDYIFYGVKSKDLQMKQGKLEVSNLVEGRLQLLGRFGLLSGKEVWRMYGLPTKHLASDHLSLIARFLLLGDSSI